MASPPPEKVTTNSVQIRCWLTRERESERWGTHASWEASPVTTSYCVVPIWGCMSCYRRHFGAAENRVRVMGAGDLGLRTANHPQEVARATSLEH